MNSSVFVFICIIFKEPLIDLRVFSLAKTILKTILVVQKSLIARFKVQIVLRKFESNAVDMQEVMEEAKGKTWMRRTAKIMSWMWRI